MKFLTYATPDDLRTPQLGVLLADKVIDLAVARTWAQGARSVPAEDLPASLIELIYAGQPTWNYTQSLLNALEGEHLPHLKGANRKPVSYNVNQVMIYPPMTRLSSLRDFYAFEAHVTAAFAIRGREVPPEWHQFPVFYFSNPNTIYGPGETIPYPSYTQALDYELEVACVIARPGIDIPAESAEEYIFGYTIFNDWSARDIQQMEMRVGLGPAKGKDFPSSFGPWIVTSDELADRAASRPGVYDLEMTARVNGQERYRGNWKDIHYSFGEMIARASAGTYLLPGDVIGSGTVGTGCLLEMTKGEGPWLEPGDQVELEIERLGKLVNRVGKQVTIAGT